MIKLLITGGSGQLGSVATKYFLKKGYSVTSVLRRTSSPTNWRWKELDIESNKNFSYCFGDMQDQGSLDRIIKKYQPDLILNTAAQSFVGVSWDIPINTIDITGLGAVRLFESVRNFGNKNTKIIQCSSSEMFGCFDKIRVLNENSSFHPMSPYAAAKLLAHYSASIYRESYDMFINCAIMFNYESRYRGIEFVTRKITDSIARIKLGLQEHIVLGNIDAKRDWSSVNDIIRGVDLIMQQESPDDYILCSGKTWSVKNFVEKALIVAGLESNIDKYIKQDQKFMRPADVGYLLGDPSKAKEELGWEPKITFDKLIEDMVSADIKRVGNENNIRFKTPTSPESRKDDMYNVSKPPPVPKWDPEDFYEGKNPFYEDDSDGQ